LLVAALQLLGPGRGEEYLPLPKWRKKAKRASVLDMITLLRENFLAQPTRDALHINVSDNLLSHAYT